MISMIPAEAYACGRSRLSSSQDTDNYKKLQDDAAAATMTTIIVIIMLQIYSKEHTRVYRVGKFF